MNQIQIVKLDVGCFVALVNGIQNEQYRILLDNQLGCGVGNHYYKIYDRLNNKKIGFSSVKINLPKAKKLLINLLKG
jgi:trans-aconitate methyltransferase